MPPGPGFRLLAFVIGLSACGGGGGGGTSDGGPPNDGAGGIDAGSPTAVIGCEASGVGVVPALVLFGKQPVGGAAVTRTITVTNLGTASATVTGAAAAPPFSVSGFPGMTVLSAGESLSFDVVYTPATAGPAGGALTVTFAEAAPRTVQLRGHARPDLPTIPLTGCDVLDVPGATYELQNDVGAAGTCFSVQADDVTLDLRGHSVTYGTAAGEATYGVLAAACWAPMIGGNPCGGTAGGFRVTNGSILQGAGAAMRSHGIFLWQITSSNNIELDHLTITVSAHSSVNIVTYEKNQVDIHDNLLVSQVTEIENRHAIDGLLVRVAATSGPSLVRDNTLSGGAQGGILVANAAGAQVYGNDISQDGRYANDFSIYGWSPDIEVFGNLIHPVSGRGIQTDRPNARIFGNQIEVTELEQNDEYGGCQAGGAYGIQLEAAATGVRVFGNTVVARADQCDARAFRATGVEPGTDNLICDNVLRAERVGGTTRVAAASSIIVLGGVDLVDNTLIGDSSNIDFPWEGASGVTFAACTFERGANPAADYATLSFGNTNSVDDIVLRDPVFAAGAAADSVRMLTVGHAGWGGTEEYRLEWTLQLSVTSAGDPVDGATVTISDANGLTVFTGTTDGSGRVDAPLAQLRRYNSGSAAENVETYTPHLVTVGKAGVGTATQTVTMDARKAVTIAL